MSIKTYQMAIRDTLMQEMKRDDKVFVMGEDVQLMGGVFGCTRDIAKTFGDDRCFNTPISEAATVGAGLGAACAGMRPVVEIPYIDFTLCAMDQIVNQVAKTRYIFGGKARIPLVIRGQQGIGRGNAATHSQSLEAIFMHVPGLKVVCPSTPYDVAGMLRTAIRDDNPVMFIEHKALYATKGEVPDDSEHMVEFGKACVKKEGSDVTIVANLLYVGRCLEAAQELEKQGISAEVIDIRSLVPFDYETIENSVKKTGRLITVHEAHKQGGWGAEVASEISSRMFRYLDCAPIRLGAKHCPLPFNLDLESAVVPQVEDIVKAAKQSLYY